LGAAWFATRLRLIRDKIRPIYRDLGILPPLQAPVEAIVQDSVAR
jgi:hypothetical protein